MNGLKEPFLEFMWVRAFPTVELLFESELLFLSRFGYFEISCGWKVTSDISVYSYFILASVSL